MRQVNQKVCNKHKGLTPKRLNCEWKGQILISSRGCVIGREFWTSVQSVHTFSLFWHTHLGPWKTWGPLRASSSIFSLHEIREISIKQWSTSGFHLKCGRLQNSRFRKARSAVSVILECEAREPHTPAGLVPDLSFEFMDRRSRSQKIRLFCSLAVLEKFVNHLYDRTSSLTSVNGREELF